MTTILGIAGSLRQRSWNAALLRAAASAAPEGVTVEIATLHGVPLYDGDVEAEHGLPEAVVALKARVAAADGLLLVTPEYNGGIPGVFKNGIDWMSRGTPKVFPGKPVGLMGASPGRAGTLASQVAWLSVLRNLGTAPFFGASLHVGEVNRSFDAEGNLIDPKVQELVERYMQQFTHFITRIKAS